MHEVAISALSLADHVRGAGLPLVLLHGGAGSHRHWDRVVEPLARRFEVHAPDLPGFGSSPDVPPALDGDGYVATAAASLDALVPDAEVHLVGFSFGGAVAAGVARAWGKRVVKLSVIGPGGFGTSPGRRLDIRSLRDAGDGEAEREVIRHNLAATMFADAATADAATVDQQRWNIRHARFHSFAVSYQERILDDLAHVDCPLQLILGARDAYAYPSPEARAARVAGVRPDVRVDMVAGAGHWAQHERPDAVAGLLLDFHAPRTAPLEKR
jgi:pimeloyl-ACP methyl ester carboxylesterase